METMGEMKFIKPGGIEKVVKVFDTPSIRFSLNGERVAILYTFDDSLVYRRRCENYNEAETLARLKKGTFLLVTGEEREHQFNISKWKVV
jgi:hypothetical protein